MMEAAEPKVAPRPTTEATALLGNRSDTTVYMLADQPWWAEAASAIRPVASQRWGVSAAKTTGKVQTAQRSRAVLRVALTDQPRRKKRDGSQPPPMLRMQVAVETTNRG